MPICPKCGKLISEKHYERHLRRCGATDKDEPKSLYVPSATAQVESPERGITYDSSGPEPGKRDWRKVLLAGFVITLLIGSVVVFLILYALSFL